MIDKKEDKMARSIGRKTNDKRKRLGMHAARVGIAAFALTLVWISIPAVTTPAGASTPQATPPTLDPHADVLAEADAPSTTQFVEFIEAPEVEAAPQESIPLLADSEADPVENVTVAMTPVVATTPVAAAPPPPVAAPTPKPEPTPEPRPVVVPEPVKTATVAAVPTVVPKAPAPSIAVPLSVAQPDTARPAATGNTESLDVNVGQSVVIDTPWPVSRVSITKTDIADVEVLAPNQVLVIGNELGTTDMILWSEEGYVWHSRVNVMIDLSHVHEELTRIFPQCNLDIQQSQDVLIVGGQLRRIEQIAQLRATLDSYDIKYVDKTSVAGLQQVMLNVRVAEVTRDAIRALGVNAVIGGNDFFGGVTVGPDMGGALNPISIGAAGGASAASIPFTFTDDLAVASGITLFGGFPGADLEIFLQALAENKYLRLLAEPSLVALSGEEANFLAGGEFPVPVVQGTAAGAGSTITIEYKEFGVRLRFIPTVLGENRIRLYVAPEVSTLSEFGAVEIEGFRIPAIRTRRSETTLEVNSGQAFVMAGLLNDSAEARNSSVPVLGDLPIIGSLFRSVRYVHGETELVVMVTAQLVEPTSPNAFPVPGALHDKPSDWELFADGRLDARTKELGPVDADWLKGQGLDRLHGPGAWTQYGKPAAKREVGANGLTTYEAHQLSSE